MSKLFTSHFHEMNEAQKGLAESLYQLSLKETSLRVSVFYLNIKFFRREAMLTALFGTHWSKLILLSSPTTTFMEFSE